MPYDPSYDGQRNAITAALMEIARPQPQPQMPQMPPMMQLPQMPPQAAPPQGAPTPGVAPTQMPLAPAAPPPMGAGAPPQPGVPTPPQPGATPVGQLSAPQQTQQPRGY